MLISNKKDKLTFVLVTSSGLSILIGTMLAILGYKDPAFVVLRIGSIAVEISIFMLLLQLINGLRAIKINKSNK